MTERDIQKAIKANSKYWKAFIPNVYFNSIWEADLIKIDSSFMITEYEIKVSKSDFNADFNKTDKHRSFRTLHDLSILPNMFVYVCPDGLIDPDGIPEYAGLLYIVKNGLMKRLRQIVKPPQLHSEIIGCNEWRDLAIKMANRYE